MWFSLSRPDSLSHVPMAVEDDDILSPELQADNVAVGLGKFMKPSR